MLMHHACMLCNLNQGYRVIRLLDMDEEEELRLSVKRSEDPLCGALRLAAAGNQIDFAGSREVRFVMEEVYHRMNGMLAVDDSGQLFKDLKDAKSVLYIGDN